jgi:dienelactone hydrolase
MLALPAAIALALMAPHDGNGVDTTVTRLYGYTGMPARPDGCLNDPSGPVNDTTALAVYPVDASATKRYPFIAVAHGMGVATSSYTDMLKSVAAAGYIAIAPDADENNWCERQWKDQIHSIDVAYKRRAEFPFSAIDWGAGVGLLGHSMGAHATVQSAGLGLPSIKSPVKVKAAIAFAPQEFGTSYANQVKVPMFYVTCTEDKIVDPSKVLQQYDDTSNSTSKVVAEVVGFNHMSLALSNTFSYFSVAFFNCHIHGTATGGGSCDSIYDTSGKAWCPLCGNLTGCPHQWPMKTCKHHKT